MVFQVSNALVVSTRMCAMSDMFYLSVNVAYTTEAIPFCGTTLPKGADIVILTRSVSRQSSDVPLGPNNSPPSVFDPSRYLVQNPDTGCLACVSPSTSLGGFLGFGYGVRSCPGRVYSEALSYTTLVSALQRLSWTLAPDHPQVQFVFDVVYAPAGDIQLVIQRR